jgi:glutamate dehydrogenase
MPREGTTGRSTEPLRAEQDFATILFARTAAEDLAAFAPQDRALMAERTMDHLRAPRLPGRHAIALIDIVVSRPDGRTRELTLIDIVNDNMPFLLDSVLAEIGEQGLDPLLVTHPILAVERDAEGKFVRLAGEAPAGAPAGTRRESLIQIQVDRIDDPVARERLVQGLERTLGDVRVAVGDWAAMRGRLLAAVLAYKSNPPPLPAQEIKEALAFLEWVSDDNFTLLGIREYRYGRDGEIADALEGTGLGILRDPGMRVLRRGRELVVTTPEITSFLKKPVALIITKANVKSRVHRRAHLDYLGIKLFSPEGILEGELRVVGLFTASAYTGSPTDIPYLRHKVSQMVAKAGFDSASYSGRALTNVLETFPRDELFQIDVDTLYRFALAILQLSERPRIRALARADAFDRFVSVLVYIPKDRYDTTIRRRVGDYLARVFQGRLSASYPAYPEGPLARTHFVIGRDEGKTPRIAQDELEAGIRAIVRTWQDALREALDGQRGGEVSRALAQRYADSFSAAYREAFSPEQALADIAIVDSLGPDRPRAVTLMRREGDPATRANLRMMARGSSVPLSDRVPVLERFGFRVVNERTYRIVPTGGAEEERVWLHDMALERRDGAEIDVSGDATRLEAALMAQFRGLTESDGFDALVMSADLGWRDVAMVRALGRYLQQARAPYGQDYLASTLARHVELTQLVVGLFYARFDPRIEDGARSGEVTRLRAAIEADLSAVTSLDDDRILRRFVNLVEAALRTNFFQIGENGLPRATIAFKFQSARVEGLPLPLPLYEIFVYSPRVEGVHLRFGKVARGGLRWSDRPQDFRTEVLSLVKAQQVKNAVIVPVGAKGGFVPKLLPPPSDRAAWLAEGTESYRIFVRTLLELTDNIVGAEIVPPPDTVRHDGDDPYLVVAADKGTATFSDTANALSAEKGHWLGDAFASGGSEGYDHKGMGITARGAWEAVKRHFREMNIDIQSQPISVAGVGDMSGDVFGNGMLLSRKLRLVAAFDHRDIFLDPEPDPEASFVERERLFSLPRSSWQDYDKSLISPGGGVYPRSLKSIPLSPQVRAALGVEVEQMAPQELLSAILKAPVDLLWFGGIGTYIRAGDETDEQVGDRANDAIRITGAQVRAKVMGEGANLGCTQRGRIEAARKGVRLNTDAIDNSAGVNTSDVEVNIKIGLSVPERDGRLDPAGRSALLAQMTDEVGALVLRNNYLQTLALSLAERRAVDEVGQHRRLMQALEAEGRLDRSVEFLPDEATLTERERRGEGLTRPELAVLIAYAKLSLHDALLASDVPDQPALASELLRYFPREMNARFPDAIASHRLRREIVATQLANAIVNRGGPAIVTRLVDQTGATAPAVARAYAMTRDSFGLLDLNGAIDALDGQIDGRVQLDLYARVQALTFDRLVWFLRRLPGAEIESVVTRYRAGIAEVAQVLSSQLPPGAQAHIARDEAALAGAGVPVDLAGRMAQLPSLAPATDIVLVAETVGASIACVAATYFAVDAAFRIGPLAQAGRDLVVREHYDGLALDRALDRIGAAHRALTREVVAMGGDGAQGVAAWTAQRAGDVARLTATIEQIAASGLTLSKLTVAAGLLSDLVGPGAA